jgi:hypothetical protein
MPGVVSNAETEANKIHWTETCAVIFDWRRGEEVSKHWRWCRGDNKCGGDTCARMPDASRVYFPSASGGGTRPSAAAETEAANSEYMYLMASAFGSKVLGERSIVGLYADPVPRYLYKRTAERVGPRSWGTTLISVVGSMHSLGMYTQAPASCNIN